MTTGAKPRFALDQATVSDGRRGVGRGFGIRSAPQSGGAADGMVRGRDPRDAPGCASPRLTASRASFSNVMLSTSGDRTSRVDASLALRTSIQRLSTDSKSSRCKPRKSPIIVRDSAHAPARVKNATASAKVAVSAGSRYQRWPEAQPRTRAHGRSTERGVAPNALLNFLSATYRARVTVVHWMAGTRQRVGAILP